MTPPPSRPPAARQRRWRARARHVRDIALEPLARQLGYRPDPRNPARFKLPGSVLSISRSRFFDHRQGTGGGGAIDLVMHARSCRFQQAVEFLEDLHGRLPAAPPSTPSPAAPADLRLPPRADSLWPAVHHFLVSARGLDPALLQRCRRSGLLYADSRRNAVFVCRNARLQATGAELVGSRPDPRGRTFKGMAPGSRKARGGFFLPPSQPPRALLLVESAIDALSAHSLLAPHLPPRTQITSTAGVASSLPAWLQALHTPRILCAFDADPAGDLAARALQQRCPQLQRLRPAGAKDWNDLLLQNPSSYSPPPPLCRHS